MIAKINAILAKDNGKGDISHEDTNFYKTKYTERGGYGNNRHI